MSILDERAGLRGSVALIAGGGGGLGRASALDLARAGVHLAICDRNEELLRETAEQARSYGVKVITALLDVRVPDAVDAFFQAADAEFDGRLDVLINVVGGSWREPFADSTPRGWENIIKLNFTWMLNTIHLAIPRMRASGGGSIINFTSSEAHRAAPGFAVYAAMKAAMTSLTQTLALELAADKIRINTVAPDYVPTEGLAKYARDQGELPDQAASELRHRIVIPLGRPGTYEDIGSTVLFLASHLSDYITGMSFHTDGGVIAAHGWHNWPDGGWMSGPSLPVAELILKHGGDAGGG